MASFAHRFSPRRAAILLLAAAIIPFLPALGGEFLYDDFPAILKNPSVQRGDVGGVFSSGSYWREEIVGYRPIATLSFIANRAASGDAPWAFHATNLALHAINTLLVAALARRLLVRGGFDAQCASAASVAGALLFAVHPAQVEAVAGIAAGRAELLSLLFVLAALVVSLRERIAPWSRAVALGAFYLIALLSKESALVLPALLLVLHGRTRAENALRLWHLAPCALALAAYIALRHAALGRIGGMMPAFLDNPLAHAVSASPAAILPGALRVLSEYARLIIFPAALSADYGFDAIPLPPTLFSRAVLPGVLFAVAIAGAVIAVVIRARRPSDALAHSLAATLPHAAIAILVTLAIPLHLVSTLPAIAAERFLCMPMAFVALIAASLAGAWLSADATRRAARPALRAAVRATAIAVVLILAARSGARAFDWRNERALFESSARAKPGSARLHNALGIAYANEGNATRAEAEYRRALEIYPEYAAALVNIGNVELRRGDAAAARARYERAVALDPNYVKARWNLAVALEKQGDVNGAAREYGEIAMRDATHFDARLRLGEILAAAGRAREAERAFTEALALRPGDAAATRALDAARASAPQN
ncbi:MAG: tetratricopeptide repeat protein [bacterium]